MLASLHPASGTFFGRKVYLGVVVMLVMAIEHGLSARRRRQLIEQLDLYPRPLPVGAGGGE